MIKYYGSDKTGAEELGCLVLGMMTRVRVEDAAACRFSVSTAVRVLELEAPNEDVMYMWLAQLQMACNAVELENL